MGGKTSSNKPADQVAELREHAERTREALGETMQELSSKLDVQARAQEGLRLGVEKAHQAGELAADKAHQATEQVTKMAQEATAQVKDAANRTFEQAERKIGDLPEPVREPARQTVAVVRQRPVVVLLTLAGLFVLWRLLSRRGTND
jgi:flagellar biosynthesis/type III secretory pathway protein FliH